MTVGTSTFMGLALPLYGEAELTQQTLGTDILTITGAASQTGDFIVARNSAGTEKFVVDASGNITAAGTQVQTGNVTFGGTVYNSGNTTIKGTLSQSGAATLGSTSILSGNVTAAGTAYVSGNATMGGTMVQSGNATLAGTVVHSGSTSFNSRIAKMVLGTVALGAVASNASSSSALTGLTTNDVVQIYPRAALAAASAVPVVWVHGADSLGFGAPGVACAAQTVNVWYFTTA